MCVERMRRDILEAMVSRRCASLTGCGETCSLVTLAHPPYPSCRVCVALGIDMTARNLQVSRQRHRRVRASGNTYTQAPHPVHSTRLQDKAKKAGLPWSAAKGFDTFNPVR